MLIAPPRSVPVARASIPFGLAASMEEFIGGLEPLRRHKPSDSPPSGSSGSSSPMI
jgi:hypothetical protein